MKALADSLKHCSNLQILNLQWNRIGNDGTKALVDSLKHCSNLHTLILGGNRIGEDGAKALAIGLKHCSDLQTLNLRMNRIGADGAKALADGLKHCNSLVVLQSILHLFTRQITKGIGLYDNRYNIGVSYHFLNLSNLSHKVMGLITGTLDTVHVIGLVSVATCT